MNWVFILAWLTLGTCAHEARVVGIHEEVVVVPVAVVPAHVHATEKICESNDKVCQDELIERQSLDEKVRLRAREAQDSASLAGEKMKHKAHEAQESASQVGEKIKHKAHEAYDSAAESATLMKDKITDAAHHIKTDTQERLSHLHKDKKEAEGWAEQAYFQGREKVVQAGHAIQDKAWFERIGWMHPIIPGFRAWLAIFTAIGAQLGLGWAWYQLLFKRPFQQALEEDRFTKFGSPAGKAFSGVAEAAHVLKEKAVTSTAGQKLANSAAAQKISNAGETMKEKLAEGRDKLSARDRDSKVKWVSSTTATQPAPVVTQQLFSASTPQVTTTTMPFTTSTAPIAPPSATVSKTVTSTFTSTNTTAPEETSDAAQAAFMREKEKPLLTYEPTAGMDLVEPYSVIWGPISSLLVATIRSFFMFHWLRVLWIHSTWGALSLALFFFFGSQFLSIHHAIWEGRPLKLMLIDQGAELALTTMTALVVYELGIH